MSKSGSSDKRKSIFGIHSLTHIHPISNRHHNHHHPSSDDPEKLHSSKVLRKRPSRPSLSTSLEVPEIEIVQDNHLTPVQSNLSTQLSPTPSHHSLGSRAASATTRPTSSVFGSLRSMKSNSNLEDDNPPVITTTSPSSAAPSLRRASLIGDFDLAIHRSKTVLHHGEVQTSSSMFRKKKEYLALTDTHIVRYKSQAKAADSLAGIPNPNGRSPPVRHMSSQSFGSSQDVQSIHSDSSGDKEGRVPLRQIVAVHKLDHVKPYYAIEVCYLDEESTHASAMTMQFSDPEDRDLWLRSIREAANKARILEVNPVSVQNSRNAARAVERAHDYDPANFSIYKIIHLSALKPGRSSTDDVTKIASTVCFLAIGIHKVHIIPLPKANSRTSSPSLIPAGPQASHGILSLTNVRVHTSDDTFELTFRQPLKRPKTLYLASLAATDIAIQLHHAENLLRPDCDQRLYKFSVPRENELLFPPPADPSAEEHCCFERTLTAYCIAYDVNPSNICYTIDYSSEDAPTFQLLPLSDTRRGDYTAAELLAVMRALRYNESFSSLSFAGVHLDVLNGNHDSYGYELVCSATKKGTPIRVSLEKLRSSCLLVQEIRALAATNKKLRRMDFSGTITTKPPEYTDDLEYRPKDIGCGIVEALFPLCRHQTTNVDWIALNGIHLSETDLDYLVGAAVDKACHFRSVELSRCSLTDRTFNLIMDAFRAQENTLEALDISGNLARLSPTAFDSQISIFGFIRKLNLSYTSRTNGSEPLLSAETLQTWRLEELKLTGTNLNENTIEALATYLRHPQSNTLRELILDHCFLTGRDIAILMQAMVRDPSEPRHLHLDISHNNITKDHDQLFKAIASDYAPTHLTLRAVEYREEHIFRHLVNALRVNRSIKYLDVSRASLANEIGEETSQALERLFAENEGLEDLNISGEESRLENSRFGAGFVHALEGLGQNKTLHVLHVQYQGLGLPGGTILAGVLGENNVLRELHCEHNEIPLSALTDMINSLGRNTTLVYLPMMDEGRAAALKQTEAQVKTIRDDGPMSPVKSSKASKASKSSKSSKSSTTTSSKNQSSFGVFKGLVGGKKSVSKTTSSYTPSFPSLSHKSSSTTNLPASQRKASVSSVKSKANPSSPVAAPLPQLSDQDIQAALRLVAESWGRQQYRLQQYLQRNVCILQGIPTAMEIEEEEFERPPSVGSLSKLLENVKIHSTPTAEKELDFSSAFVPMPWMDKERSNSLMSATSGMSEMTGVSKETGSSESGSRSSSISGSLKMGGRSIRSERITTAEPPHLELPMIGNTPPEGLFRNFMFGVSDGNGNDSSLSLHSFSEERRGNSLSPVLELGGMNLDEEVTKSAGTTTATTTATTTMMPSHGLGLDLSLYQGEQTPTQAAFFE